ncbi:alpha-keto acid decarboxylase family protein [Acetobacteraceae bacterium B3987]|nr:alpha-keto acid decarboxylase family protein [Acetobacteraceae bacterium B3987]
MVKVVDYLLDQLAQLGVEHVFGVPGDYAFPINDAITGRNDMRWIGCSNELNAAYAADGYARMKGIAVLNTTYGVGELSAMNGVGGAYAEHLPVIHLVGMPRRAILNEKRLVHHTLGDGRLWAFYEAADHVVCARTILDGQTCVQELKRVLTTLRKERRPIYIGIPADAAYDDVVMAAKGAARAVLPVDRGQKQAEIVVRRIVSELKQSKNPCVLPGILTARFGCRNAARQFLTSSGLPYATMYMDKGVVSEQAVGFVGMYGGHLVQEEVANFVEQADLVLALGAEMTDFSTGLFTQKLPPERVISVMETSVQFGDGAVYEAALDDVVALLAELADTIPRRAGPGYLGMELSPKQDDEKDEGVIRTHTLCSAVRDHLRAGDVVVCETGTVAMGMGFVRLPDGVDYEEQSLWGAIGWATPAAFGMALAVPHKRIVLLTGEGSHQLTVQALGEFARFDCQPLILVLNNEGYLIERLLCDDGERYYNDIASWDYTALARGFGCEDWHCERVSTPQALRQALDAVVPGQGAYLEVVAPRYDAPAMAEALGHKQ